jgi:hypothetical protein
VSALPAPTSNGSLADMQALFTHETLGCFGLSPEHLSGTAAHTASVELMRRYFNELVVPYRAYGVLVMEAAMELGFRHKLKIMRDDAGMIRPRYRPRFLGNNAITPDIARNLRMDGVVNHRDFQNLLVTATGLDPSMLDRSIKDIVDATVASTVREAELLARARARGVELGDDVTGASPPLANAAVEKNTGKAASGLKTSVRSGGTKRNRIDDDSAASTAKRAKR